MIFYFQFVHYSDKELVNIKDFIYNNFYDCECHLISNNYFLKNFNINNTIGKFLYINISNFNINNIDSLLHSINTLKKNFIQLNLFFVQMENLFISPIIFERFTILLKLFKNYYINNFNMYINLLNFNYSLLWSRINLFHLKFYIISMFLNINNFFLKKSYLFNYN